MAQEMQQMFGVSAIGILGTGFVVAILLLILGVRERSSYSRRVRLLRAGGFLIGLMIIITELAWYVPLAIFDTRILTLEDVIILTLISSCGGIVSGISCYIPISQ